MSETKYSKAKKENKIVKNQKVETLLEEGTPMILPLSSLKPSEYNEFEITQIEEMKNSIRSMGLLTPLCVIGPYEDNTYSILSGERRYTALKELAKEDADEYSNVQCNVIGPAQMSEPLQKLIIETSNVETRDFVKGPHYFRIVELLYDLSKGSNVKEAAISRELAKTIGKSERYARFINQVFRKGSEEIKSLVTAGKLPIDKASKIMSLDEEDQKEIIEDIKNGLSANAALNNNTDKKNEKFSGKKSFDLDELAADDLEIDDFTDLDRLTADISTDGTFSFNSTTKSKSETYTIKLRSIFDWANGLLDKEELTDEEIETLEKCKEATDKFL